jgi:hypothetical protein
MLSILIRASLTSGRMACGVVGGPGLRCCRGAWLGSAQLRQSHFLPVNSPVQYFSRPSLPDRARFWSFRIKLMVCNALSMPAQRQRPDAVMVYEPPDETMWEEIKRVVRPIVVDTVVLLVILVALFFGYLGLRALDLAGYDKQRIATFETLHYWFYTAAYILLGVDLLFKLVLALFFRNRREGGLRG